MSTINVYYAKLNNAGDLLSEYLIPEITGCNVKHCENVAFFDVMGVGSCGGALWTNKEIGIKENIKDTIKYASCFLSNRPCAVWGTGFLKDYSNYQMKLIRKNVSFIAVRGALSKKIIEHSLKYSISPVMCDGGILVSALFDRKIEKKYSVGFIAHYNEQTLIKNNGIENAVLEKYKNSTLINLREDPIDVIRKIAECEIVISSSLHGCVIADSFHIPNMRIRLSGIPGTGFKFDDYYSAYGLTVPAVDVFTPTTLPRVNEVIDRYKLEYCAIEKKKTDMANVLKDFVSTKIIT